MKFYINSNFKLNESISYPHCRLAESTWNDWGFLSTFTLTYYSEKEAHGQVLGSVKIGKKDMNLPNIYSETVRTPIENEFTSLDNEYFSLGNSSDYYRNLYKVGLSNSKDQQEILNSLRDVVYDRNVYFENERQSIMQNSLMRNISRKTILDVYSQVLTTGNENLTAYKFSIKLKNEINDTMMNFSVTPEMLPQSNIHTLIGRNGVGKTNFFKNIILTLTDSSKNTDTVEDFIGRESISSVLALSYSIFDTTLPKEDINAKIPYKFIGFIQNKGNKIKDINEFIIEEFIESVNYIREHKFLYELIASCLDILNSDPIFESLQVRDWFGKNNEENLKTLYSKLSSGHKIVLLNVVKIIINVEPNSIVLIDEPEQNLHPPLISSFVQALLNVLKKRNAMAIIATHSPVIVQECTTESTWILNRSRNQLKISRPTIKTFGANVGAITYDIFDLEVDNSGYMNIINEKIEQGYSLDEIENIFNNKLGEESSIRIASILFQKEIYNGHK
ncbi:AAA family ATPase [Periweissella ghanensis]|uniref:ATPase AAA-type core domain-containing protein n=1 Tax=Periweissella ghanensis TaxID=467997 RepID=A0ABM8ZFH3_9LACO|nr:AAA family ATPase [Periweissella ghanensis]MCM0601405.1 AAA family ATPase [Periweissella ghanensis]CAH0419449.1 hypothetical protein WGH24286_01908 [Periweissella ghanensis]